MCAGRKEGLRGLMELLGYAAKLLLFDDRFDCWSDRSGLYDDTLRCVRSDEIIRIFLRNKYGFFNFAWEEGWNGGSVFAINNLFLRVRWKQASVPTPRTRGAGMKSNAWHGREEEGGRGVVEAITPARC